MTTQLTFSRQDRLDNKCSHSEYYNQFVDGTVKAAVKNKFGIDRLKKAFDSGNTSFNSPDFRLSEWDGLAQPYNFIGTNAKMKELGDYLTLAGQVCILKEAARQLVSEL
jgi:hypothetical protein